MYKVWFLSTHYTANTPKKTNQRFIYALSVSRGRADQNDLTSIKCKTFIALAYKDNKLQNTRINRSSQLQAHLHA